MHSQGAVVSDGLNSLCLLKWQVTFFLHSKIHLHYHMSFLWDFFFLLTNAISWMGMGYPVLYRAGVTVYGFVHLITFSKFWQKIAHVHAKLLQSCFSHTNPMDCSPPGSSVHGILQARILEWVAMPSSRRSSQPRDRTRVSYISCNGKQVLYH